jgi:hypothetical protein
VNDQTALDYWTLAIALVGAVTGVAALVTQVWGLVLSGARTPGRLTTGKVGPNRTPRWTCRTPGSGVLTADWTADQDGLPAGRPRG